MANLDKFALVSSVASSYHTDHPHRVDETAP